MDGFYQLMHSFLDPKLVAEGPENSNPFKLECSVDPPATAESIAAAWPESGSVPGELRQLWLASGAARLFKDVEYGQWGLELLSPAASAARSAAQRTSYFGRDLRPSDIIIGAFIGDQEVLVFAPSEPTLRRILVAIPLYDRDEWYAPEPTIYGFLTRYRDARGEQYWLDT